MLPSSKPRGVALPAVTATLVLTLLASAPLPAQTTSASVLGSVVDSRGGVLPGAAVTLTSRTQANTLSAIADREGRFVFPIVRPDTYTLRVSNEGFRTLERTNVVVSANDRFSAGVLTLEVGVVAEEVSVTGRVSEVQAHSGERSYTLEAEAHQGHCQQRPLPLRFHHPRAGRRSPGGQRGRPRERPARRPAASRSTGSGRTPTTSRSTASPTSTPATTAVPWRRPTSTPSPSSRS